MSKRSPNHKAERKKHCKKIRMMKEALRRTQQAEVKARYLAELEHRDQRINSLNPQHHVDDFLFVVDKLQQCAADVRSLYDKTLAQGKLMLKDSDHRFDTLDMSNLIAIEVDVDKLQQGAGELLKAAYDIKQSDDLMYKVGVAIDNQMDTMKLLNLYTTIVAFLKKIAHDWREIMNDPSKIAEYSQSTDVYFDYVKDSAMNFEETEAQKVVDVTAEDATDEVDVSSHVVEEVLEEITHEHTANPSA